MSDVENIKNVLNFSGHTLSKTVQQQLIKAEYQIETVSVAINPRASIKEQVQKIVDSISSIPVDGSIPFIITLPGLSELTAFLLAELHGRTGFFPMILQVRRSRVGTFEIAENNFGENIAPGIADLEKVRLGARGRRFKRMRDEVII